MTRAAARLLALRMVMADPKATRVQVAYSKMEFEEAVRSERGIVRICTESEKTQLPLP